MLNLKKLLVIFAALTLLGGLAVIAMAGDTANQSVSITVPDFNEVSVSSGVSIAMTLNTNKDGIEGSDDSTNLIYTTNGSSKKITAYLQAAIGGITLKISISDGESNVALGVGSEAVKDVITGLSNAHGEKQITYNATGALSDSDVSAVVVFTITS